MPDCVALLRYRTDSGIVSFFQSGTRLTGCRRVRYSDSMAVVKADYSYQCCGSGYGSGRVQTFLVRFGSGRLGPDPDKDPGLNKLTYFNYFGVFTLIR
jgi:hypothetical protein